MPSKAVLEEIDAKVDFAAMEATLMEEGLKKFAEEGYAFDASASDTVRWVFRRKSAQPK